MTRFVIVLWLAAWTAGSSKPASAAPPPPKAKLVDAENRAWAAASPVLHKYCGDCHVKGGKSATRKRLDHFNFTSYPITGHHADKIGVTVRRVLGLEGKKAIMPFGKSGTVTGDDLATIKKWADAWDAADQAGAHAAGDSH
jgi:uncharacterized membrane protein